MADLPDAEGASNEWQVVSRPVTFKKGHEVRARVIGALPAVRARPPFTMRPPRWITADTSVGGTKEVKRFRERNGWVDRIRVLATCV